MTQVTDDDGRPLSAVLLSLSAGQFRSNNLTLDNGTMIFPNLVGRCCLGLNYDYPIFCCSPGKEKQVSLLERAASNE